MKRRSFLGSAAATTIFMSTGFKNPLAAAAGYRQEKDAIAAARRDNKA